MPVYEYQGQHYDLPEGLSNEQAVAKIKTHLGGTSEDTQTQPSDNSSFLPELGRQLGLTARAGITGLSSASNAVTDFLSGAANLGLTAAGSEQRVPYLSQLQQQGLNQVLPVPRPGLEQSVQTGAEALASLMTPGLKAPMAPQAEGATGKEILRRSLSEAAGVATGAMAGESAAKKTTEVTGSPWAGLAAGLATGTVVGSGTGKALFAASGPRTAPTTIEEVRARARQGYKAMDDANVSLRSDSIKEKLLPSLEKKLEQENYDPMVVAAHKPLEDNINLLKKILTNPYTDFNRLEKIRGSLSSLSQGSDDQARLAKIAVGEIDSFMANINNKDVLSLSGADAKKSIETLKAARADWRNQSRAQVLQDVLDSATVRAEGSTGATGDKVKQGLVNLAANTQKMKVFSTSEQNVIKAASKATDLETMLSLLAKFNPERGALQTAIATGNVMSLDTLRGQVGTGLAVGGFAADKTLAAVRKKEVQDLISQIASGNLKAPKEGFAVPGLFGAAIGATQ